LIPASFVARGDDLDRRHPVGPAVRDDQLEVDRLALLVLDEAVAVRVLVAVRREQRLGAGDVVLEAELLDLALSIHLFQVGSRPVGFAFATMFP
jgi:hypothetical protein